MSTLDSTVTAAGAPSEIDQQSGATLSDLARILLRYWLAILLATVIGIAIAAGWAALQPRMYTSDASGIVSAGVSDNVGLAFSADSLSKSKAAQFESLVSSRNVASQALELAGIEASPQSAISRVAGSVPRDTAMLNVSVEWGDPALARELADAWVAALVEEVDRLENQGQSAAGEDQVQSTITFSPMVPANHPTSPSSPNVPLALALGALIGLTFGVGYALIRYQFDRRIRSSRDLEAVGLPVIGTIPVTVGAAEGDRLQAGGSTGTAHGFFKSREAFKELRTNLQFMNPDRPPRIITVTSALPGDGKSTVAANLAIALAETTESVLLVDADLRKPTVAETFGLEGSIGLSDVVVGRAPLEDVIVADVRFPNLHLLPAGQIPPNPSEILASDRLRALLRGLSDQHMVILDAPPLLPVTDGAILSARFDGAVLVVQAGSTRKEELAKAMDSLAKVNAGLIGGVVNRVPTGRRESSDYAYYGHRYDYYEGQAATNVPQSLGVETPITAGAAPVGRGRRATRERVDTTRREKRAQVK